MDPHINRAGNGNCTFLLLCVSRFRGCYRFYRNPDVMNDVNDKGWLMIPVVVSF
jgi:hypothetical protein